METRERRDVMSKKKQTFLFEQLADNEDWRKEWQDMPEFKQEDLTSVRAIKVHFRSEEDALAFGELIGQKITPKLRSLWFPEAEIRRYADKRYVDES